MCVGEIARLADAWDEDGVRVGRLDDGSVVSLSFLPEATSGSYVLVHLGIPVETVDEATALAALALRADAPLVVEAGE